MLFNSLSYLFFLPIVFIVYWSVNNPKYHYVPFFRYCRNDLKIGFREVLLNLIHKKTNALKNDGYTPLTGTSVNYHFSLPAVVVKENKNIDSIQRFCKKNNIEIVLYCAPFCKNTKNLNFISKLKHKLPRLYDFSSSVKDDDMFQNATHLNDKGARFFTNVFIDEVLNNKK